MIQIGVECHRGSVREKNEDAYHIEPERRLYIVADGVGGNNSGEVASNTAVSEIAGFFSSGGIERALDTDDIFEFMADAIIHTNDVIYDISCADEDRRGMATTVVVAYLRGEKAYIANVGDSRAYLCRNEQLKRVTKDHTYVNELVDKGLITQDEAKTHRRRNVITKALGAEPSVEPDFYMVELQENDVIMLCSDGLYGEVEEGDIAEVLGSSQSMNDACETMLDMALEAGGRDNITIVCIKI